MRNQSQALWALALVVVCVVPSSAAAQALRPRNFPVQYAVKFVCGFVPDSVDNNGNPPPVKPGNYATAINIGNHTTGDFAASKRVLLHHRMGADPLPPIPGFFEFTVSRQRVLEIDCVDVWMMLDLPPETFVKGMIHFGVPQVLQVTAVYTAQTRQEPVGGGALDPGAGISIDVEDFVPIVNMNFAAGTLSESKTYP